MKTILLFVFFALFFILLQLLKKHFAFPKYFRAGSMRVIQGINPDEFQIEVARNIDGTKSWIPVTTLRGWDSVIEYALAEEERQKLGKNQGGKPK